jgi:hypothetical protein
MRPYRDDDDDGSRVIRDGETLYVPMFAMDALQRAIATDPDMNPPTGAGDAHDSGGCFVVDAAGSTQLHRPGARFLRTPATGADHARLVTLRAVADDARAAWLNDMQTAWRVADAEPEFNDEATDGVVYDAVEGQQRKDAAWGDMIDELQNAWRTPHG